MVVVADVDQLVDDHVAERVARPDDQAPGVPTDQLEKRWASCCGERKARQRAKQVAFCGVGGDFPPLDA